MSNWKPIKDAPNDGRRILIRYPDGGMYVTLNPPAHLPATHYCEIPEFDAEPEIAKCKHCGCGAHVLAHCDPPFVACNNTKIACCTGPAAPTADEAIAAWNKVMGQG